MYRRCEKPEPRLEKSNKQIKARDLEDTCKNREKERERERERMREQSLSAQKSEPQHLAFWSLERWVLHLTVLLRLRPTGRETPFSSVPLWPGNYPNLPSSCAPAPVPTLAQTTSATSLSVVELANGSMSSLCKLLSDKKKNGGEVKKKGMEEEWEEKRNVKNRRYRVQINIVIKTDNSHGSLSPFIIVLRWWVTHWHWPWQFERRGQETSQRALCRVGGP